jgi:hypothetical protein
VRAPAHAAAGTRPYVLDPEAPRHRRPSVCRGDATSRWDGAGDGLPARATCCCADSSGISPVSERERQRDRGTDTHRQTDREREREREM